MDVEKDKELCRKYPMLYAQRGMGPMETCMYWGFEIGDGWHGLIDRLSAALEEINRGLPEGERVEAVQVKEKFGGLRFYVGGVPNKVADRVYALIDEAEKESYRTCESCGKPGKPSESGWITAALCKECGKPEEPEAGTEGSVPWDEGREK